MLVIRSALRPHAAGGGPRLWGILEDPKRLPSERLRAACALAAYAPDDPRWAAVGRDVAGRLAAENGLVIGRWAEALEPVRRHLLPHLAGLLIGEDLDAAARRTITGLYGDYARGLPDAFDRLEEATGEAPPTVDEVERLARARRRANAATALAALGRWDAARRLLVHTLDPTTRSYLIDRLGPGGAGAAGLEALIDGDGEPSARRAAILALAEYDEDRLPSAERERLAPRLAALYRDDPDPGVHAATDCLLRRWGRGIAQAEAARPRAAGGAEGARGWSGNSRGQTMVILPPGEFQRGLSGRYRGRVDHRFALAAREVTAAEFRRFRKDAISPSFASGEDCPVHKVSWYDAAAYCNWLSEQDGIPRDRWCYLPNNRGQYAEGMRIAPDALSRRGYRLPTADEWEYACRAGGAGTWSLGDAQDLPPKYAWFVSNSWSRLHPVGTLRPNDWSFFDMHGNAWEWCQEAKAGDTLGVAASIITDAEKRVMRGGAFGHDPLIIQCSNSNAIPPTEQYGDIGLRPARTIP